MLVVDAAQGVEAQTVANAYLAVDNDARADPGRQQDRPARGAIRKTWRWRSSRCSGFPPRTASTSRRRPARASTSCSRRSASGFPSPARRRPSRPRALIFDSDYDDYRGVIVYFRVFDGALKVGDRIRMMGTGRTYHGHRAGHASRPQPTKVERLGPARWATWSRRSRPSATSTSATRSPSSATSRRRRCRATRSRSRWSSATSIPRPATASGSRPTSRLREALEKLRLNDASFTYADPALRGARLRLPLRVPRPAAHGDRPGAARTRGRRRGRPDRADRHLRGRSDTTATIDRDPQPRRPARPVARSRRSASRSSTLEIICPTEYIGDLMKLCDGRRGIYKETEYLSRRRGRCSSYELPLAEIIYDFYDKLKSHHPRLRHDGLRDHRLPRRRPGEGRHPRQRPAGRRAVSSSPPRQGRAARPR